MTERVAIIDLGSNSARLIVMHIYVNGAYNLVYHQKETVRLSQGLAENDLLQTDAIERAVETMEVFAQMCHLFKADKIIAVATAAVRNARNGPDLLRMVHQRTGISLRMISGETEAFLGYIGVINTIDVENALLFDLGGGSLELTLIRDRVAQEVVSLPLGAVVLTERFGTSDKASDAQLAGLREYIISYLEELPWLKKLGLPIIGIGGTARNIAKMDQKSKNYPIQKVHNYRLGYISFNGLYTILSRTSMAQRRKVPGLSGERADIIVAGATAIKCLFDATGGREFVISGCGLREGLFLQHYLGRENQSEIIPDILMHSARNMLLFYKGNIIHAYQTADLAEKLFEAWQHLHGLDARDRVLLRVASLLHDIGITINYYDHSRHSAYLVENARLFGLSHREQMLCAVIAGWHGGPAAKYMRNRTYSELLDERDWDKARKMALLVAMAESLDVTQRGLVHAIQPEISAGRALLQVSTMLPAHLELAETARHKKWFKREFGLDLVVTESGSKPG